MKKSLYKPLIMLFILVALVVQLVSSFELFEGMRRWDYLELIKPMVAVADSDMNLYIVDNEYTRIVKINRNGQVEFVLHGNKRGTGKFYNAYNIKVDEKGYLYVYNEIVDPATNNTGEVQILRYTPKGEFDKLLLGYKTDEDYASPLFGEFDIKDGVLDYCLKGKGGTAEIWLKPLNGDVAKKLTDMPVAFKDLDWFALTEDNRILYTTNYGRLFSKAPGLEEARDISSSVKDMEVPSFVMSKRDKAYLLSLNNNSVYSINKDDTVEEVLNGSTLINWGYDNVEYLLRNLSVGAPNILVTIDVLNNKVVLIDKEYSRIRVVNGGFFCITHRLWLLAYVFELFAGLVILFYLIGLALSGIKKSVLAKQMIVFVFIFLVAVTTITIETYSYVSRNYYKELENRLLTAVQYGAGFIDGDTYEKIVSPRQYNSAEHKKIKEELKKSVYEAKEEWNSDLSPVLYKVKDGHFYLDTFGVYYYDDVTEVHKRAYFDGKIGFTKYKDSYGTWLSGVAPVKNSKGEIVGVYECLIDGYILVEKNTKFVEELLFNVLLFAGLFIAAFIIWTRYQLEPLRILKQGINKVAAGEYDETVKVIRNDEIGELTEGFNSMTAELKKYSGKMESLVAMRTEELEKAVEDLRETQLQLVQTEKMAVMGQLVAGIVHEVNTPLASLKSNIGIEKLLIDKLEDSDSDSAKRVKEKFHSVHEINLQALDRLTTFLGSLRRFISLDESDYQEANINDCIDSALMILNHEMKDKVTIEKRYQELPKMYCHVRELNQAFLNILINMVRTVRTNAALLIKTSVVNDRIQISISDNHGGMTQQELERMFDPSFVTKDSRISTGLGLTSAYKTIEQHEGAVKVWSSSEGTGIDILLPLKK